MSLQLQTIFACVLGCFQTAEDGTVMWSQKERVGFNAQTPYGKKEGDSFPGTGLFQQQPIVYCICFFT